MDDSIEQNIVMDSKNAKINQENFELAVKVAELDFVETVKIQNFSWRKWQITKWSCEAKNSFSKSNI